MAPAPLEFPAALMFEVVVTLGVSAWAWSLARAGSQSPVRWGSITMAGSFIVHRAASALMSVIVDPSDVYSSSGQLAGLLGPFVGSILVFMGAPLVLGHAIPSVPRPRGG
ncbi:MAG: hypothetical protein K0V04_42880 [Deltaproteobacteria bacterium]|nr:hypothetical protein [Deltaproteobacteria bacterium]